MNHVVCVKWGNKYVSKYANILYSMVKRHTTLPFEFHCITDNAEGLDTGIKTIMFPGHPWIKTWWSKLWMFSPEMPLEGNILFFDLDVVIHNNIDQLFKHNPGKFMIIRDFNRCRVKDWKQSNSSCMRWEAGTMNHLYTDFVSNYERIMKQNWGDQDWIMKAGKEQITHWPDEWIRSYKWEMVGFKDTKLRDKNGKWFFKREPTVTKDNCVAVFHGQPNPMECADRFVVENWK